MDGSSTKPLFELRYGEHVWRLYEDGRTEGFPSGTTIVNNAAVELAALKAKTITRAK